MSNLTARLLPSKKDECVQNDGEIMSPPTKLNEHPKIH